MDIEFRIEILKQSAQGPGDRYTRGLAGRSAREYAATDLASSDISLESTDSSLERSNSPLERSTSALERSNSASHSVSVLGPKTGRDVESIAPCMIALPCARLASPQNQGTNRRSGIGTAPMGRCHAPRSRAVHAHSLCIRARGTAPARWLRARIVAVYFRGTPHGRGQRPTRANPERSS